MPPLIRSAQSDDASAMAAILNAIISIGGTTAYRQTFDAQSILDEFVETAGVVSCYVALVDDRLVGFQALHWRPSHWIKSPDFPADWGAIATFVDSTLQTGGIGRALFAHTKAAAEQAGLAAIDATIRKENTGGQTYYGKMGFVDYRSTELTISKRFDVGS